VPDVQITVGFRWKTGRDPLTVLVGFQVLLDDLLDEIGGSDRTAGIDRIGIGIDFFFVVVFR